MWFIYGRNSAVQAEAMLRQAAAVDVLEASTHHLRQARGLLTVQSELKVELLTEEAPATHRLSEKIHALAAAMERQHQKRSVCYWSRVV